MACGGLAPTIRRALLCEAAVTGETWNEATIESACDQLANDFTPITDMRASADFRLVAVQNLLRRFWLETRGELDTTVYGYGR